MADMTTIHGMLTEIAASTAFTPDALKQFQDALARTKELEQQLEAAKGERGYYKKLADDRAREITQHEARIEQRQLREDAVSKREATMTALETKVAVAEAKESVRMAFTIMEDVIDAATSLAEYEAEGGITLAQLKFELKEPRS